MILREIVHTCSNAHVARAALASIGGDFARRFAADASRRNVPVGVLAASMVRDFSAHAANEEWDGVDEAVRGADQPILSGLRYILSQRLSDKERMTPAQDDGFAAPWMTRGAPMQSCCCA
jgi:hypothetical protein